MGLVKTRRLAAMRKQQRAKAVRKCCQWESVANGIVLPVPMLPISNLGRGYGAGRVRVV